MRLAAVRDPNPNRSLSWPALPVQVHDEVILEGPRETAEQVRAALAQRAGEQAPCSAFGARREALLLLPC